MTPGVLPNWASGNQNQLIPKVAFFVATVGSGRVMLGVPRSRTWNDEVTEVKLDVMDRRIMG